MIVDGVPCGMEASGADARRALAETTALEHVSAAKQPGRLVGNASERERHPNATAL